MAQSTIADAVADVPSGTLSADVVLLPLRLFLGATFIFAGLQKFADPHFFQSTSTSSIQSQLRFASAMSPIGSFLHGFQSQAFALGLVVAFAELAIGIATLLGLWTRIAAFGGAMLSLSLWLAITWHTHPYYLASDVVFLVAWLPLVLSGPSRWSLDNQVRRTIAHRSQVGYRRVSETDISRRTFLAQARLVAVLGAGAVAVGGVTAVLGRLLGGTDNNGGGSATGAGPVTTPPASQSQPSTTTAEPLSSTPTTEFSTPTTNAASGTPIATAAEIRVGGAKRFSEPANGGPAYVVQPSAGKYSAFSATCTHAGCPVDFSSVDGDFHCPCHGAIFAGATGAVLRGPARLPLPPISVTKGSDGQLYVS